MEALRKITVKEVLKGKPPRWDADGKHDVIGDAGEVLGKADHKKGDVVAQDLCFVMGRCRDIKTGNTQFGDYNEFIGRFEARQLIGDKKTFQATRLIVPPPTDDILAQGFFEAKGDDKSAEVDFAYVIGVEYSDRGTEGYRFTCRPLRVTRDQSDPLAALKAELSANEPELAKYLGLNTQPALPAPDADDTDATGQSKSGSKKVKEGATAE